MFANIMLLTFQMYKNEEGKAEKKHDFLPHPPAIATVIATVDKSIAKMFRHILGSRILYSLSVVFCSI